MSRKVKECSSCGQGFDEDNNLVGIAILSHKCAGGKHEGPIARINNPAASGKFKRGIVTCESYLQRGIFFYRFLTYILA